MFVDFILLIIREKCGCLLFQGNHIFAGMVQRCTLIIALLILLCPPVNAAYYYDYNEQCHKAYSHYMALQFREGNAAIIEEIRNNPENLMATYIADYADCMLLLFNGDRKDYEKLHFHLNSRLGKLDKGDPSSPWYRLCKAGIYMHWAFIYIRLGENFKAAATFRKSYILLKENKKRFPDFEYNDIFFGLEEAVVGTVPDDYKWIASIFGLKGNVKKGVSKLSHFINTHNQQSPLYYDAVIYHTYLSFYLMSEQESVWQYVNSTKFPAENNLLFSFIKTNIALNYRKTDAAIQVLNKMQQMQGYSSIPAFEYEMGSALYYKLDDNAMQHFEKFQNSYKGEIFVKDAYSKMANIAYLNGNRKLAQYYLDKIKTNGSTDVDADRKAARFAENNVWPSPVLLQASLLIDGGYYKEALQLLSSRKESEFGSVADKAEYNLRMGRIYDELANDDKALQYYNRTIAIGNNAKEYFAARAALQSAFIYEKRGDRVQAVAFYQKCIDMPVQDYKNAIKQQAKAGMNRLGF
ncbi:MAG: hypothetical protein JNK00_11480 [Flavipsychrobacter sp.]|nr:hypothetical protein [Flavipsychrobacter sp.]